MDFVRILCSVSSVADVLFVVVFKTGEVVVLNFTSLVVVGGIKLEAYRRGHRSRLTLHQTVVRDIGVHSEAVRFTVYDVNERNDVQCWQFRLGINQERCLYLPGSQDTFSLVSPLFTKYQNVVPVPNSSESSNPDQEGTIPSRRNVGLAWFDEKTGLLGSICTNDKKKPVSLQCHELVKVPFSETSTENQDSYRFECQVSGELNNIDTNFSEQMESVLATNVIMGLHPTRPMIGIANLGLEKNFRLFSADVLDLYTEDFLQIPAIMRMLERQ